MPQATSQAGRPAKLVATVSFAIGGFGFFGTMCGAEPSAPPVPLPFEGEKVAWHGFDRYDFLMDERTLAITAFKSPDGEGNGVKDPAKGQRRCIVVVPKEA